jgi:sugar phosphate isomerase/epimerase
MRLALSNIAWAAEEDATIPPALAALGVAGIEIAPSRLWPDWIGATPAAAASLRDRMAALGLAVPAVQAALFARPALHLFGAPPTQRAVREHMTLVAAIAGALGAASIVFGAPRNRDRGPRSHAQAMADALPVLRAIGDACAAAGTCLCLEANPPAYACNFLTTWQQSAEMAALCAHPGIGLHLDTACIQLAGGDPVEAIAACAGLARHFHISEPELGGFAPPTLDHACIGAALRASPYRGWVSIEMRRQPDPLAAITAAIATAQHYV